MSYTIGANTSITLPVKFRGQLGIKSLPAMINIQKDGDSIIIYPESCYSRDRSRRLVGKSGLFTIGTRLLREFGWEKGDFVFFKPDGNQILVSNTAPVPHR